jgi:hypothetical protein
MVDDGVFVSDVFLAVDLAALEAVETLERIDDVMDREDAADVDRCTDSPRLVLLSVVADDGVTRRDRTDDAMLDVTDERPDAMRGVLGTDDGTGGAGVRDARVLCADEAPVEERRGRNVAPGADMSDLADLNVASLSAVLVLLVGREEPDGAPGSAPPADVLALLLRMVDARERTDVTLATDERGVVRSFGESNGGGLRGEGEGDESDAADWRPSAAERKDEATDDELGVSFESGRSSRRPAVDVPVARDVVVRTLRAVECTELAEEAGGAVRLAVAGTPVVPVRAECMLIDSASSGRFATRRRPPVLGLNGGDLALVGATASSSSIGTSISAHT